MRPSRKKHRDVMIEQRQVPPDVPAPLVPVFTFLNTLPLPASDGSLTYHGVTLYGGVDMGVGYQTHGNPLNLTYGAGRTYLVTKINNKPQFGFMPNAISNSNIGLKGIEEITPGVSVVFNMQTTFVPPTGILANGRGSQVQNNGVPQALQTSNGDSSRNGQAFNSQLYGGLSSPTFGTLTFGRQYSLTLDGVVAYDPMSGSNAFSVIGYSGTTSGAGDTEDGRLDNTLKYRIVNGPFRAAALYQFANSTDQPGNAYQFQLGADYKGFSFDAIYSRINDAVSTATIAAPTAKTINELSGTVSDNTSVMLLSSYKIGALKLYAAFEDIRYANPGTPLPNGAGVIGGYTLATVSNTAYTINKLLQVYWTGAKYGLTTTTDLTVAYYRYNQNSYKGNGCSNASFAQCSGSQDAISMVVDHRFSRNLDVYAGAMYSRVDNGLANGYLKNDNFDPTVGARFQF
jgi:predicted porin